MTMKVIELVGMIFGPKTLTFFSMAQQMLRFIYLQLQGANYAQTLNLVCYFIRCSLIGSLSSYFHKQA